MEDCSRRMVFDWTIFARSIVRGSRQRRGSCATFSGQTHSSWLVLILRHCTITSLLPTPFQCYTLLAGLFIVTFSSVKGGKGLSPGDEAV